jgi:hypothetical protein
LSYDKFTQALGRASNPKGLDAYSDGKLDVEQTALNTYNHYTTKRGGQTSPPTVKNLAAYLAVKDAFEWNQCITKVGEV